MWAACIDRGPGPEPRKVDPAVVRARLLPAAPQLSGADRREVALGGGAVIYLGNRVDRTRIAPGEAVTITHFWRVVAPVGPGWRVFTLVRGRPGDPDFMNPSASDMQFAYGPARWQPGDVIVDPHTLVLRPDWRAAEARILVGLIALGGHAIADRMVAAGRGTEDRAIVAREIEVDVSRAPPLPGTVHVPRAAGPISIDGALGDPGWATAAVSPELVTAEGSAEPVGRATARITWDDTSLYVAVSVADSDIYSSFVRQDDPLWKGDCVELFIDADGDRRGYVELQVSPNNVTFDAWFAGPRGSPIDAEWDSGMTTAVLVNGTGNVAGDADRGWDAEIAIPWAAVKGRDAAMAVRTPPAVGDRWRLNIVRVDRRSSGEGVTASSWNRINQRDFHALDRLLTVVFADASGSIAARVAPAMGGPSGLGGSAAGTTSGGGGPGGSAAGAGSGSSATGVGSSGGAGRGEALAPRAR
jgi:hypothetical protein